MLNGFQNCGRPPSDIYKKNAFWKAVRVRRAKYAKSCQISSKSAKRLLRYRYFSILKMAVVSTILAAILDYQISNFCTLVGLRGPVCIIIIKFHQNQSTGCNFFYLCAAHFETTHIGYLVIYIIVQNFVQINAVVLVTRMRIARLASKCRPLANTNETHPITDHQSA